MDSDEMKKTLAENSRKITVLQVNESHSSGNIQLEMERQLRKEKWETEE